MHREIHVFYFIFFLRRYSIAHAFGSTSSYIFFFCFVLAIISVAVTYSTLNDDTK